MRQPPTLDKRVRDALADWRKSARDGWESGYLGLVSRYVPWFDAERIEYAFTDELAIQLHGGDSYGLSAYLVVTPSSWERMLQTQGTTFRATREGDRGSLTVNEMGYASVVQFSDSLDGIRVCIHGVWVVSLSYLLNKTLSRPAGYDLEIATSLIRANGLDETFQKALTTRTRRAHYLTCLAAARKQRRPNRTKSS